MVSFKTVKGIIGSIRPSAPAYLPKDYPDLTGKFVLITGCSAGVGKESAKLLLKQNATVVFANRSQTKTDQVIEEIKESLPLEKPELTTEVLGKRIVSIIIDLSDLNSIKPGVESLFAKGIHKLDIVILNAGVMEPPSGSITKQGWELQFGTNVIGHQLLIDLLTPLVLKAKTLDFSPRVIFLSSLAHIYPPPIDGGLTFDFKDAKTYSPTLLYGQSKTGNIYQAYIYGEEHKSDGIISLSVHPGLLNTELARYYPNWTAPFFKLFFYDSVYGAYTELFAALNPDITVEDNGRYVVPWGKFGDIARDDIEKGLTDGTARKMWDFVEKEIEIYK